MDPSEELTSLRSGLGSLGTRTCLPPPALFPDQSGMALGRTGPRGFFLTRWQDPVITLIYPRLQQYYIGWAGLSIIAESRSFERSLNSGSSCENVVLHEIATVE